MMTMTTINYSEGLSRPTFDDDFFAAVYGRDCDTSEGIHALDLHAIDDDCFALTKGRDSDRNKGINVLWG